MLSARIKGSTLSAARGYREIGRSCAARDCIILCAERGAARRAQSSEARLRWLHSGRLPPSSRATSWSACPRSALAHPIPSPAASATTLTEADICVGCIRSTGAGERHRRLPSAPLVPPP
eukprot:5478652-Prymnesium_polylepis.1